MEVCQISAQGHYSLLRLKKALSLSFFIHVKVADGRTEKEKKRNKTITGTTTRSEH